MRVTRIELENFKAFERFTMHLGPDAFLVGPNNAGKSTLVAAIRSGARMIAIARQRNPTLWKMHKGFEARGHQIDQRIGLETENLRHQFRRVDTSFRLATNTDLSLTAVWPAPEDDEEDSPQPFFFLSRTDHTPIRRPVDVREQTAPIGIVPGLYPINRQERVLETDYVRSNLDSRLASQHARNHLYQLREMGEFDDFRDFALHWLPEVRDVELRVQSASEVGHYELDVFLHERDDLTPKELFWAGDGIQIFVQILFHVWRLREANVIVLDEPDLYLHADLQRRLVRLLNSLPAQSITATHSPEMLAEAPSDSVIWVDKSRRRAIRRPKPATMEDLSESIGSAFNLRLAAALRSRVVVFVEGEDMTLLRHLAATAGAESLAAEDRCAVIGMRGGTQWPRAEPFKWLLDDFLDEAVDVFVLLDRDYQTDKQVAEIETTLRAVGIKAHVWRRKEIENYLLVPAGIARLSKRPVTEIAETLNSITDSMIDEEAARLLSSHLAEREPGIADTTVLTRALPDVREASADAGWRLERFSGKTIFRNLNRVLQTNGHRTVSPAQVARELRPDEIPPEVSERLLGIQEAITFR